MKLLAVGAAAAVLLAPGAAMVGVATLVSPAAAGTGSCLFEAVGTGSLGVTGDVPSSLSAGTGGMGVDSYSPGRPREFGVEFRRDF